jgi:hypothetical protein
MDEAIAAESHMADFYAADAAVDDADDALDAALVGEAQRAAEQRPAIGLDLDQTRAGGAARGRGLVEGAAWDD